MGKPASYRLPLAPIERRMRANRAPCESGNKTRTTAAGEDAMAVADLAELAGVTPKTWHRWRDEGIRWQEADRVVASVLCDHLEWLYEADLLAEMDAAIGAVDALDDWPEDWPP